MIEATSVLLTVQVANLNFNGMEETKLDLCGLIAAKKPLLRRIIIRKLLCLRNTTESNYFGRLSANVESWGVGGVFVRDTVGDLCIEFKATLNQHGYHNILQQQAVPPGWRLVGSSLTIVDPTDLQAMYRSHSGGKAADTCSAYVGTPSLFLEKLQAKTSWICLRKIKECAKPLSKQKVESIQRFDLICVAEIGFYVHTVYLVFC